MSSQSLTVCQGENSKWPLGFGYFQGRFLNSQSACSLGSDRACSERARQRHHFFGRKEASETVKPPGRDGTRPWGPAWSEVARARAQSWGARALGSCQHVQSLSPVSTGRLS